MRLSAAELEILKTNSLNLRNAKDLAKQIEADATVSGIFPKGAEGDYSNPNIEIFKRKWCSWWPVARLLLPLAKIFTNDEGDKKIDAIIELGDSVCN